MKLLGWYQLLMNVEAFVLCARDKWAARHGRWRLRERTLLLCAAVGGSAGMLIGMLLLRHKTRHLRFMIGVPLLLALQLAGLVWLWLQ